MTGRFFSTGLVKKQALLQYSQFLRTPNFAFAGLLWLGPKDPAISHGRIGEPDSCALPIEWIGVSIGQLAVIPGWATVGLKPVLSSEPFGSVEL